MLYAVHGEMERQFARLTKHGGGLMPLGNWVRHLNRVRLWVQAKRIIHGLYVYLCHSERPLLAGAAWAA